MWIQTIMDCSFCARVSRVVNFRTLEDEHCKCMRIIKSQARVENNEDSEECEYWCFSCVSENTRGGDGMRSVA